MTQLDYTVHTVTVNDPSSALILAVRIYDRTVEALSSFRWSIQNALHRWKTS